MSGLKLSKWQRVKNEVLRSLQLHLSRLESPEPNEQPDEIQEVSLETATLLRVIDACISAPDDADKTELLLEAIAYAYAAVGKVLPSQDYIARKLRDLGFRLIADNFVDQDLGAGLYYVAAKDKAVVAVALTSDQQVASLLEMSCDMYGSPLETGILPKDSLIN